MDSKFVMFTPIFRFCFLFFIALSLPTLSLTLSDKLEQAEEGDFAVSLIDKSYTLIHLMKKRGHCLLFEEITVPVSSVKKKQDWHSFVQEGAKGAIAWVLYEIDIQSGKMLECYSMLDEAFLNVYSFDHLLTKLMHLPLSPLEEKEQRRIGSTLDGVDGVDHRKIWTPIEIFEGVKVKDPKFSVYKATWPEDGTILARKSVEIYFDTKRPTFPFPFWMQVKDESDASFKVPTVDGGHRLKSPLSDIPRRKPYFYDKFETKDDSIIVKVSLPIYYEGMKLYASSFVTVLDKPILCEATMTRKEGEEVEFEIPKSFINNTLEFDKPYHFLLTSDAFPDVSVESPRCIRFVNTPKKVTTDSL